MSISNITAVEWLEPWSPVSEAESQRLEIELRRELAEGHPIFGRPARAVASRCDCDDVLFELRQPAQFAVVHLAYAPRPDLPPWPTTELFADLDDFVARRMNADHSDYTFDAG